MNEPELLDHLEDIRGLTNFRTSSEFVISSTVMNDNLFEKKDALLIIEMVRNDRNDNKKQKSHKKIGLLYLLSFFVSTFLAIKLIMF